MTRLDQELWRRGLVRSRTEAALLVDFGRVMVGGQICRTRSKRVAASDLIEVVSGDRYVGRGGFKLSGALDGFGLDPRGRKALDVGSSTGGFVDCLLQRGAEGVVAVDIGIGQLAESLRADPRVTVVESTDIRSASPSALGGPFPLVVADLSFISIARVAGALASMVAPGGDLLVLVKPQFEVGRGEVRRGVVKKDSLRVAAVEQARTALTEFGLEVVGESDSDLAGEHGNREVFLWAKQP